MKRGKVIESKDTFLSPFHPTIEDLFTRRSVNRSASQPLAHRISLKREARPIFRSGRSPGVPVRPGATTHIDGYFRLVTSRGWPEAVPECQDQLSSAPHYEAKEPSRRTQLSQLR